MICDHASAVAFVSNGAVTSSEIHAGCHALCEHDFIVHLHDAHDIRPMQHVINMAGSKVLPAGKASGKQPVATVCSSPSLQQNSPHRTHMRHATAHKTLTGVPGSVQSAIKAWHNCSASQRQRERNQGKAKPQNRWGPGPSRQGGHNYPGECSWSSCSSESQV